MSKESPVGLGFAEAAEKAMADLAESGPSPASDEKVAAPAPVRNTEHPTNGENEKEEEVGRLSVLYDDADDGEEEQPEGDSAFTVNGERVTLDELRKGYLRQSDYTKKTQELATEKEQLENARLLWESFQKDPRGTLNELTRRINMGQNPAGAVAGKQAEKPATDNIDELVAQKVQEILGSNPRLKEFESQVAQREAAEMFEQLEADYAVDLTAKDREFVQKRAQELGISDAEGIRLVFAGLLQEAQRKQAARKELAKAGSGKGRFSGPGEDEGPEPDITDFWSAAAAAAKSLGLEELLK